MEKKRIAIFASGSGSNAQKIIEYFKKNELAEVSLVLSNNADAYVLERAQNHEIPSFYFDKDDLYKRDVVLDKLRASHIDWVILAGFLWLMPKRLVDAFPQGIINIHPALLPKYGGKGMYGDHVHLAVMAAQEPESGITIHYINEKYDEGDFIHQAKFKIEEGDTLEMIRFKCQQLEHQHFPKIIEREIIAQLSKGG